MKDSIMIINVAKDFSRYPAGRYLSDGPYTGQRFLEDKLLPALEQFEQVKIIVDGTLGYGSSFLEEAFGGLIRLKKWSLSELLSRIIFVSQTDPNLIPEIKLYMQDAADRLLHV